jgi:hypothetical protein
LDYDRLAIHHNVQKTVDMILRGLPPRPEIRVRTGAGMEVVQKEQTTEVEEPGFNQRFPALARSESAARPSSTPKSTAPPSHEVGPLIRIFPYGIARTRLERAIREKRAPAYVTNDVNQADAVMAIRSTVQAKPKRLRDLSGKPINTVVVKSNTFTQIAGALDEIVKQATEGPDYEAKALQEAQNGIENVLQNGKPFELSPAPATIRKMQHQMAEARRLASESVGDDPNRRLRILPTRLP